MLKGLTFSVMALAPTVAMAGGGGGADSGNILVQTVVKLVEKLIALF